MQVVSTSFQLSREGMDIRLIRHISNRYRFAESETKNNWRRKIDTYNNSTTIAQLSRLSSNFHCPSRCFYQRTEVECSLYQHNCMFQDLVVGSFQKRKRRITVYSWNFWRLNEQFAISSWTIFYMHQKLRFTLTTTLFLCSIISKAWNNGANK